MSKGPCILNIQIYLFWMWDFLHLLHTLLSLYGGTHGEEGSWSWKVTDNHKKGFTSQLRRKGQWKGCDFTSKTWPKETIFQAFGFIQVCVTHTRYYFMLAFAVLTLLKSLFNQILFKWLYLLYYLLTYNDTLMGRVNVNSWCSFRLSIL